MKFALALGTITSALALLQAFIWPDAAAVLFAPGGLLFMIVQGGVHDRGFEAIFIVGTIFNIAIYSGVFWLVLPLIAKLKRGTHA
jgi:hypothetical protein